MFGGKVNNSGLLPSIGMVEDLASLGSCLVKITSLTNPTVSLASSSTA